ncbi:galactokinase [bacterium]|nr:galactokinase [bacterium]
MAEKTILAKFQSHFGGTPAVFAAPGRVNLIGEHTDYNDGYVFPMAINFYTQVAVAPRDDRNLQIWSENMQETILFSLDSNQSRRNHWSDYVAGVADELEKLGVVLPGADLYIDSQVPVGAGLSSSAAIEMATALALAHLANASLEKKEFALLGQRAENRFVGMNCGIMDQFISMHAESGHALMLDCRSLDFSQVPLKSDTVRIVVCNSLVKHELASSEYNKRRAECEEGVHLLQARLPGITHLRDVSLSQFNFLQSGLPDTVAKRCRHVISENQRVLQAQDCLAADDLQSFARLMNKSHNSLRDDYEVSCGELDLLVDLARAHPACLGSRMTGGGFGGCTVNLVRVAEVDAFIERIRSRYSFRTGLSPQVYICMPSRGAHRVATSP